MLTNFFECGAKARGSFEVPESSHGIISLFNPTMILFQSVVEVRVGSMDYIVTQSLSNSTRVTVMTITGYSIWSVAGYFYCLPEESLGCFHISILLSITSTRLPSRSIQR